MNGSKHLGLDDTHSGFLKRTRDELPVLSDGVPFFIFILFNVDKKILFLNLP